MHQEEIPLSGGNSSSVVRIGNTVHRTMHRGSRTVHALLQHLESHGFTSCPRLIGIDAQGREMLTYLAGDVGFQPYIWSDESVVAAATLLRKYHDTTQSFVPPADAIWPDSHPDPQPDEVICHNDFAPYNLVFAQQKPYALIDFDGVSPGPRIRDVAFGVYWFAPLSFSSDLTDQALDDLNAGSHRLRLFCTTYGMAPAADLLTMVDACLDWMGVRLERGVAQGDQQCKQMIAAGHLVHWRRERDAFRQYRMQLEGIIDAAP